MRRNMSSEIEKMKPKECQSEIKADVTSQTPPLKIIYVDDDTSMLAVAKAILEEEANFLVDAVLSPDEAFKKL